MTEPKPATDGEAMSKLEKAADQAIEACGGDARAAVIALLVANDFLECEPEMTQVAISTGFSRGWHRRKLEYRVWYNKGPPQVPKRAG